jgi:hypothetical protein
VKRLLAAWFPSPFSRAKKKKRAKYMTIIYRRKRKKKKKKRSKKTKDGVDDELYSLRFVILYDSSM